LRTVTLASTSFCNVRTMPSGAFSRPDVGLLRLRRSDLATDNWGRRSMSCGTCSSRTRPPHCPRGRLTSSCGRSPPSGQRSTAGLLFSGEQLTGRHLRVRMASARLAAVACWRSQSGHVRGATTRARLELAAAHGQRPRSYLRGCVSLTFGRRGSPRALASGTARSAAFSSRSWACCGQVGFAFGSVSRAFVQARDTRAPR
jgi:hypothetical protein